MPKSKLSDFLVACGDDLLEKAQQLTSLNMI